MEISIQGQTPSNSLEKESAHFSSEIIMYFFIRSPPCLPDCYEPVMINIYIVETLHPGSDRWKGGGREESGLMFCILAPRRRFLYGAA